MQRENRGTIASLAPQIASQQLGICSLGDPIWGVREAIVPLLPVCMPFFKTYVLIMPLFMKFSLPI